MQNFHKVDLEHGLHVLDMFGCIPCGGLRTILEAGCKMKCYTCIEIDDVSWAIARCMLDRLQKEYPGQLPDSAIRGYSRRVPHDISIVKETDLISST